VASAVEVAALLCDWNAVRSAVTRQEVVVEARTGGSNPAFASVLAAAMGLANLAAGSFADAARSFLQVNAAALGASFAGPVHVDEVASYLALTALASFSRDELRRVILGSQEAKLLLESQPALREVVQHVVASRYAQALDGLDAARAELAGDVYIAPHLDTILRAIRSRALAQYLGPYTAVDLRAMASSFRTDVDSLTRDIANLIRRGVVSGRVDVLHHTFSKHAADPKAEAVEKLVGAGRQFVSESRALLLRASMQRAGVVVGAKPPPSPTSGGKGKGKGKGKRAPPSSSGAGTGAGAGATAPSSSARGAMEGVESASHSSERAGSTSAAAGSSAVSGEGGATAAAARGVMETDHGESGEGAAATAASSSSSGLEPRSSSSSGRAGGSLDGDDEDEEGDEEGDDEELGGGGGRAGRDRSFDVDEGEEEMKVVADSSSSSSSSRVGGGAISAEEEEIDAAIAQSLAEEGVAADAGAAGTGGEGVAAAPSTATAASRATELADKLKMIDLDFLPRVKELRRGLAARARGEGGVPMTSG
jgi:hypothetical protein